MFARGKPMVREGFRQFQENKAGARLNVCIDEGFHAEEIIRKPAQCTIVFRSRTFDLCSLSEGTVPA